MPEEHTQAPAFTLPDEEGKNHALSDYTGSVVLLYFYPKDDTPGCTKEACTIRDAWKEFQDAGITVLGVSADSTASHKKFKEKYNLPFSLLSDEGHTMLESYGVWQEKSMFGKKYMGITRSSFLITKDGTIAKVFPKVKPALHADEVLEAARELA